MNIPNRLTLLRVILVPVFVLVLLLPESILSDHVCRIAAAAIFVVTALTDMLDGKIARKYNLVTNFGKFMDPLADKFMVIASLVTAMAKYDYLRSVYVWVALIVVFRELAVTSLRLLASSETVIAAAMSGKIKTFSQCVCILVLLLEPLLPLPVFCEMHLVTWIATAVMTLFTLYSGIEYFAKYKKYISMN